ILRRASAFAQGDSGDCWSSRVLSLFFESMGLVALWHGTHFPSRIGFHSRLQISLAERLNGHWLVRFSLMQLFRCSHLRDQEESERRAYLWPSPKISPMHL